ncbi:hypothetical protein [Hymenobacter norwichensis]|uniref:hypothetical protein n=1 Tax=Hymenobacter norwichensis TaxID=223903 RepID=UPI001469D0CB|nr:hypothetical protein [Hymenobacter norwichensis]
MKSYTLASTLALLVGWGVAMLFHSFFSLATGGNLKSADTIVVAFWSFLFTMLANGLFIQCPEKYISRYCRSHSRITFLFFSIAYAVIAFTIIIGWLFLSTDFWVVYIDAALIGLGYGICFPRFWKHSIPNNPTPWTTPTTLN